MYISKSIIVNIGEEIINPFLREYNISSEKLVSEQNMI